MDIGTEDKPFVTEPLENPVPEQTPEPEPEPAKEPAKPEREKVPA